MSAKCLPKREPLEKLGNFCVVDGRVAVIEYSDLPEALREAREFTFDLDELVDKLTEKSRLLILCSPQNPTGSVISRADLKRLAEIVSCTLPLLGLMAIPILLNLDAIYPWADPDKVHVVPNAIDTELLDSPGEEEMERVRERYQLRGRFVLFAGNVKPHKNLERLIRAFALVREQGGHEDLQLLLIGDEGAILGN